jgi:hypothetical protein
VSNERGLNAKGENFVDFLDGKVRFSAALLKKRKKRPKRTAVWCEIDSYLSLRHDLMKQKPGEYNFSRLEFVRSVLNAACEYMSTNEMSRELI